jgi:DNA-binding GntR family transcriptional regulator
MRRSASVRVTRARWPKLTTGTLGDQVYLALRDRIIAGRHAPGEFLREIELATALGVSRTPVREAFARLAREGFVERLARRGYRVPTEPVSRLLELYPIVASLEVLAAELALPHVDARLITELRGINRRMEACIQRRDGTAGIALNHEFHRLLSARCGNRRLCELLEELRSQVLRLEYWSADQGAQAEEAVLQHDQILNSMERGEYDEALRMLRQNRLQTYFAFVSEMGSSGVGAGFQPARA